jgi:dimethlysulfoniopropionate lyase
MKEPAHHLAAFLADLARLVEGAAASDEAAAADCRRFAALARELPSAAAWPTAATNPFGLPVCRFWAPALGPADGQGPLAGMVHALEALGPWLVWTQNPNYRRNPPSRDFLDRYGYAVIAGPPAGPSALISHAALALGVLLLGPRTHYPEHRHPATELYVPLNVGEWWRGSGPWRTEAPGAVIHHGSEVAHATRAGDSPLLAIYLWAGDLGTHARLTGAG